MIRMTTTGRTTGQTVSVVEEEWSPLDFESPEAAIDYLDQMFCSLAVLEAEEKEIKVSGGFFQYDMIAVLEAEADEIKMLVDQMLVRINQRRHLWTSH